MYKVFIKDRPLIFAAPAHHHQLEVHCNASSDQKPEQLKDDVYQMLSDHPEAEKLMVLSSHPAIHFEQFLNSHKSVLAGGGLVQNSDGAYLFIFRNGKWDLPKGKLEEGEDIEQCAIREVMEECGISPLSIEEDFGFTYHIYFEGDLPILKSSHWYGMKYRGNQTLVPQREEGIEKVGWFQAAELSEITSNTYASILDFIRLHIKGPSF